MAGLGYKHWVANDVLSASDINGYLADQSVMRFASSAARSAAILSPSEGMTSYLDSTDSLEVFNGSSWVAVVADGSITEAKLASSAVTEAKLASGAVTEAKLASGAVTNAKLGAGAVTDDKVSSVDASKVSSGTLNAARIPSLDGSKITTGTLGISVNNSGTNYFGTSYWGTNKCSISASTGEVFSEGNVRGINLLSPGNLLAAGVLSTPLGSWTTVVTNSSGYLGYGSSNRDSKQDIEAAEFTAEQGLGVEVKQFRYKLDVEEFGDDAPVTVGVIAEELIELGLEKLVVFDDEGKPKGVHYERLALVLFPVVKEQQSRLDALEARLEKLEK